MSHDAAMPKDPAPLAEGISVRKPKPMKYLETVLSTGTEEVLSADGIKKHVTTVRRTVQR